jgi:hypothetical protein
MMQTHVFVDNENGGILGFGAPLSEWDPGEQNKVLFEGRGYQTVGPEVFCVKVEFNEFKATKFVTVQRQPNLWKLIPASQAHPNEVVSDRISLGG